MALDSKTFFDVIQKHELISEKKFLALKNAIKKASLTEADLNLLVAKKYLTKWQASRLLTGRHQFRVGDYRLIDFLGKDDLGEVYLVQPKGSKDKKRLRLVAKKVSDQPEQIQAYLQRVKSFQSIPSSRICKIEKVAEAGGRHFVVSERLPGVSIGKLVTEPQSEERVSQMAEQLGPVVSDLEAAGLVHGSLNDRTVSFQDDDGFKLDLPADIGFDTQKANQSKTDRSSLIEILAGAMTGKFSQGSIAAGIAEKLSGLVANAKSGLDATQVKNILGAADTSLTADSDSQDIADLPIATDIDLDGLESIEKRDDVFGDFDQIEVASEIQSPQMVSPVSVVVDSSDATADKISSASSESSAEDKETESSVDQPVEISNRKVLLFAALGGGVGVVVLGLLIFFLMQGNQGSDPDQKVASNNEGQADSESEDPKKKDEPANEQLPRNLEKKELKSSGMFKGIGQFNKQNAGPDSDPSKSDSSNAGNNQSETGKTEQETNPAPGNPDSGSKNKGPENQENLDASDPGKNATIPAGNAKEDPAKTKETSPQGSDKQSKNKQPDNNNESPGDSKKGDPKKGDEKKKDAAKDDGVLLIGVKKDKEGGNAGKQPSKLANPFVESPDFVTLPLPRKGSVNTSFQKLFPMAIPPSLPLTVTLHGGDKASRSKVEFEMKASTSKNATWIVSAGAKSKEPIAQFHFDGNDFGFAWEAKAGDLANAIFLTNCAIRIKASEYQHEIALREPVETPKFGFSKSMNTKGDVSISNLPNQDNVQILLANLPEDFPEYTVRQNQNDPSGTRYLEFKKENIELIRGELTPRIRGAKVGLSLALIYIAPDKQPQKITSKRSFDKDVNDFLSNLKPFEKQLQLLNTRRQNLATEDEKKEFDKQSKRVELENEIKKQLPLKKHLQNAKEVLDKLTETEFQFRVFYQSGEVPVDLATPDGKKYKGPRPALTPPPAEKAD